MSKTSDEPTRRGRRKLKKMEHVLSESGQQPLQQVSAKFLGKSIGDEEHEWLNLKLEDTVPDHSQVRLAMRLWTIDMIRTRLLGGQNGGKKKLYFTFCRHIYIDSEIRYDNLPTVRARRMTKRTERKSPENWQKPLAHNRGLNSRCICVAFVLQISLFQQ
jgi:hypothetical protein